MTKHIFITGGVVSSLGKGIAAASLGLLLKSRGLKVINQKFDPYLNIDPGTMNPYQHGEVFVTDDGAEADLDLGHYERFTDENLNKNCTTTAGKVYLSVLDREREGGYNGGTVQVIPNITDEIRNRMLKNSQISDVDVVITEIGGTVGDIESLPFIEAIRQIRHEVGSEHCAFIHLTLMPYIKTAGELKSKPTQHSVKELQGLGIQPDVIMIRSELPVDLFTREKIALFCNVPTDAIIQNLNAESIYEVPLMMEKEGLGTIICRVLSLETPPPDLSNWENIIYRLHNPEKTVHIALVGKYIELRDAYLSVIESLIHGGISNFAKIELDLVDAEQLTDYETTCKRLAHADGIILPGGFGDRGVEGMIFATQYARESKTPFFGICLGMQIAAIEFARNVLHLNDAHSTEMNKDTPHPIIDLMHDQDGAKMGGTLRLGKYYCKASQGSLIEKAYGTIDIYERHRHRYEFNNKYLDLFEKNNMKIAGINPDRNLVEVIELSGHPWMIGVQFHPEFKSRPNRAHPLFRDFIEASIRKNND